MSKAYELIYESLNEIINDLEENDGKNLKRETILIKKNESKQLTDKKVRKINFDEKFFEQAMM